MNGLPEFIKEKLGLLTSKERKYFAIMWAKYGVLFITSKPGVAKSATAKSIADKMGFRYEDIRLSMSDESDFKFPYLTEEVYEGKTIKVSGYAVPKWAYDANQSPTIIHFEELNRAPQFVRNAALQILLERQIGDFKFNDNVLMMSSGNLGDEDGTDVEEFDAALNNRLIHIDHTMTPDDWFVDFADGNCHQLITSFLRAHPEKLNTKPTENGRAYATPRSWTMMSEFIIKNFGKSASPKDFLPLLSEVATGYIGVTAIRFIQYCQDMLNVSIQDVINNYDKIKDELQKYNRDKNSELIQSLKAIELGKLSDKQLKNVVKFLENIGDDEKTAYLLFIVDGMPDITNPKIKNFLLQFKDLLKTIKRINKPK